MVNVALSDDLNEIGMPEIFDNIRNIQDIFYIIVVLGYWTDNVSKNHHTLCDLYPGAILTKIN